jgi:hypothetical protein
MGYAPLTARFLLHARGKVRLLTRDERSALA